MSSQQTLMQEFGQELLKYCRPLAQNWAWLFAAVEVQGGDTPQLIGHVRGRFQPDNQADWPKFYIGDRQDGQWIFKEVPPAIVFTYPTLATGN